MLRAFVNITVSSANSLKIRVLKEFGKSLMYDKNKNATSIMWLLSYCLNNLQGETRLNVKADLPSLTISK